MDLQEFQNMWRTLKERFIDVADRVYELQYDRKPSVRFDEEAIFGLEGDIFTLEASDWRYGELEHSNLDIPMSLAESILSHGPWEEELRVAQQARLDRKHAEREQQKQLDEQRRLENERSQYDRLKAKFEPTS